MMYKEIESAKGWQQVETADGCEHLVPPGELVVPGERCEFVDSAAVVVGVEVLTKGWVGRWSAPGYLDCTEWEYNSNLRELAKSLNR